MVSQYLLIDTNKIYCQDALEFSRTLPDKSVKLVLTDPPYNVHKNYGSYKDNLSNKAYLAWCKELVDEWKRISENKIVIVLGSVLLKSWWDLVPDAKLIIVKMGAFSRNKKYNIHLQFHSILTTVSSNQIMTDLWEDIRWPGEGYFFNEERYGHPAMTPLKLMKRCINIFSKEGDLVYEPFLGCGTTAVAATELKRKWIATEINAGYIKTAETRLHKANRGIY